jgi:hypothetical protein
MYIYGIFYVLIQREIWTDPSVEKTAATAAATAATTAGG